MSGDLRGILRPGEIGRAFSLERRPPPVDLADAIDRHWIVRWDLDGRDSHRTEVLTHPAVHLVFEPHGAFVYGVRRTLDVRTLSGRGYAIGTKFLPGGFAGFTALNRMYGLLRELRRPIGPEALLVAAAVAQMRGAPPDTRVSDVAARQAVSVRTLQRLFARYVGVGSKWVLQRYRVHEALEQLSTQGRPDWSRLALDLGYFDQAHFIRDFRAVAGRSPAEYERELMAPTT